jgi:hypothetical protein
MKAAPSLVAAKRTENYALAPFEHEKTWPE